MGSFGRETEGAGGTQMGGRWSLRQQPTETPVLFASSPRVELSRKTPRTKLTLSHIQVLQIQSRQTPVQQTRVHQLWIPHETAPPIQRQDKFRARKDPK